MNVSCGIHKGGNQGTHVTFWTLQLVTDVNIAVGVEAVQAIGNLATGLRKDFTAGSRFLLPVLLVSSMLPSGLSSEFCMLKSVISWC